MDNNWALKELHIEGMTCASCAIRIENALKKLDGVGEVSVSYGSGRAKISYDKEKITLSKIIAAIEKLDYQVTNKPAQGQNTGQRPKESSKMSVSQLIGFGIIIFAGYFILKNTVGFSFMPNVTQNMGYGILFVVGLITSIHCVAMCGGINLSQCVNYRTAGGEGGRFAKLKPSLLYNAGRVLSYTVIGGVVGAIGSVFSFSGAAKGVVAILAGVFMVIMGVNMLGVFPWLKKITPRMPRMFGNKVHSNNGKYGPFVVGLLNGLMPCGPLQTMQIYALGTGSFLAGAASMFVFSLGTVPLMFGFGALSSFLSGRFTRKMMKVSAALVVILGLIMLNRGFTLSGFTSIGVNAAAASPGSVAELSGGKQHVTTKLGASSYTPITVQKGVPVRWDIKADAASLNGCNSIVTIPQYNISKPLQAGDNYIEFTPSETGTIPYTCSMGMINSTISVVPDIKNIPAQIAQTQQNGNTNGNPDVGVAKINGNEQDVTVKVGNNGYSPAILVLQKGVPAKIKFDVSTLSSCNVDVVFPELNGSINLSSQTETPLINPTSDFSFRCGMGMLSGYVKVVDDLNKIDLNAIREQAKNYVSTGGGMACCR